MADVCVIYLCNALDEATRNQRQITTDSPAASKKVFGVCSALKAVGSHVYILSLGRGRQAGSRECHAATAKRLGNIPIVYGDFLHVPFLTHAMSFLSLVPLMLRLSRAPGKRCLVVYNRTGHYVAGLVAARILGFRCYLDLEDGFATRHVTWAGRIKNYTMKKAYDVLCNQGALLANHGLASQTGSLHTYVCYGVAEKVCTPKDWTSSKLTVLFSGTLLEDVGPRMLMAAIRLLKDRYSRQLQTLHFIVAGKGPLAEELARFAEHEAAAHVEYCGMVSRAQYLELLARSHIGLSLRLSSYEMSATTFPSKVIEYAENGLLVVSTITSDVPRLFGHDAAILLKQETAEAVAEALVWIVDHRTEAEAVARVGRECVLTACDSEKVGKELQSFLTQPAALEAARG